MKKIVYIFGAGASRNALPIVNEIPDRILKLIKILESKKFELSNNDKFDLKLDNIKTKRSYQIELIESLRWLYKERVNFASIDTFAKKLYLKDNQEDLNKLKIALSVFYICEQCINKPDNRYDTFFASLLNRSLEFPKNMRILTWNYDYQFELTFSGYTETEKNNLSSFLHQLHIITKYANEYNYKDDCCNIYKINGTTGLYSNNEFNQYIFADNLSIPFDKKFVDQVVESFVIATYSKYAYPALSFAWEEENKSNIIGLAVKDIKDTEILIVIGYSFPFFNREIDRKIIGNMEELEKVYFQAPDAETIKERFQAIRDDIDEKLLVTKKDIGQFLIPNEL